MHTLTRDEIDERACALRRHLEDAVRRVLEVRGPLALTALVRRVRPLAFTSGVRRYPYIDLTEMHEQEVLIERAVSRITYEGDVLCERVSGTWLYRLPSWTSPAVLAEDGAALARTMCDTPPHSL